MQTDTELDVKNAVTTVWVATISHEYGTNVYVASSEDKLTEAIYAYVKEWWDTVGDLEPMPLTGNAEDDIAKYFEDAEASGEYLESHGQQEVL